MALFTVAEARAFKYLGTAPLASAATYPDADINAAAIRIKERFEEICNTAFEPIAVTVSRHGTAGERLVLSHPDVTAVSAVSVDGVAYAGLDLTNVVVLPGGILYNQKGWVSSGYNGISLTYTRGWSGVPGAIKRAALIVAVFELVPTSIPLRATTISNDAGTFGLSYAGGYGHWYGVPDVDAVLQQYKFKGPR